MKTTLTTLLIAFFISVAFAQNPDKVLIKVRYSFTHIQDTTQKDNPYTENMLLVAGKNASVYTSYDKINRDRAVKEQLQEQIKNQAGSSSMSIKIDKSFSKKVSDIDYFFFAKENKFFTSERVFNYYLVEEPSPKISWKITKDTASFSGLLCQKATTYFKGRNWIAWFAYDMPFASGPWKLNGLPGLIVEAYDDKKEVQFKFNGIENIEEESATASNNEAGMGITNIQIFGVGSLSFSKEIKLPADAIKTSKKDLEKLKEARDKDPQGFFKTQMGASDAIVPTVTGVRMSSSTATPKKNVINNPIELPEKK